MVVRRGELRSLLRALQPRGCLRPRLGGAQLGRLWIGREVDAGRRVVFVGERLVKGKRSNATVIVGGRFPSCERPRRNKLARAMWTR